MNDASLSATRQLPLGVRLREGMTLESFVHGESEAVDAVRGLMSGSGEGRVHLVGPPACGKTHLLQAACHGLAAEGAGVAFVPLARGLSPALLEGLRSLDLVCLDDLHAVAGDASWERAVFHLYNEIESGSTRLLLSSRSGGDRPSLPDLASRLDAVLTVPLRAPDDTQRSHILERRARALGFELPPDAVRALLTHCRRDLHTLVAALDGVDAHALATKRRVSRSLVLEYLRHSRA